MTPPPPPQPIGHRKLPKAALYLLSSLANLAIGFAFLGLALSGRAIVAGSSVDTKSLSNALIVVGYINKVLSAATTMCAYFCVRRSATRTLFTRGIHMRKLDTALDQPGVKTAVRSLTTSPMPLVALLLSYLLSGLAKKPITLSSTLVTTPGPDETLYSNKGCPMAGGPCVLTGVGAFNNVTTITSIDAAGYASIPTTQFMASDDNGALYLHGVPGTALGMNPDPGVVGVSYTTRAVRFVPNCSVATTGDIAIDFVGSAADPPGSLWNLDSTFWVQTFPDAGLRTGMNYSQFSGGGAICNLAANSVSADFSFHRAGETWAATVTEYTNTTDPISLQYPGSQISSVPILLSDLFGETLGQLVVNQTIGGPALALLGYAGMAASLLLAERYDSGSSVSSVLVSRVEGQIVVARNGYAFVTVALFLISALVCLVGAIGALLRSNVQFDLTQIMAMSADSDGELGNRLEGYCSGRQPWNGPVYVTLRDSPGKYHPHAQFTMDPVGTGLQAKLTTAVA